MFKKILVVGSMKTMRPLRLPAARRLSMSDIVKMFGEGRVACNGSVIDAGILPWNEHAAFKGVYLKHLVKGETTGGRLSCHLIRIKAGHAIGDHIHEGKWELHEVIEGTGAGDVDGKPFAYAPGLVTVIPEGIRHRIVADREDVYLFAKFFPALL